MSIIDKKELEFAEAMKLKLPLNREQRNPQATAVRQVANEPSEPTVGNSLRASIIQSAMACHPNLTEATAQKMLEELGA